MRSDANDAAIAIDAIDAVDAIHVIDVIDVIDGIFNCSKWVGVQGSNFPELVARRFEFTLCHPARGL